MAEVVIDASADARVDAVAGNKNAPLALHCVVRTRAPRLEIMARAFMAKAGHIFGPKTAVQIRATFYSDLADSCNIFVTEHGMANAPSAVFDATLALHQTCVHEHVVRETDGFCSVRRSFTHDVCYADGVATHWEGT